MKRLIFTIAVLAFSQSSLFAADEPKSEIFGGYSFVSLVDEGSRLTLNGWNAAYQYNVQKNFGVVADFGGHYKTISGVKVNIFEYTFGPRYVYRADTVNVFGHALFGSSHFGFTEAGVPGSINQFTMEYGGGVDVKATDKVNIRVAELDWVILRDRSGPTSEWTHDTVRMSFGVVFKVGK